MKDRSDVGQEWYAYSSAHWKRGDTSQNPKLAFLKLGGRITQQVHLFLYFHSMKIHIIFTILTILSVQFSGIKYTHIFAHPPHPSQVLGIPHSFSLFCSSGSKASNRFECRAGKHLFLSRLGYAPMFLPHIFFSVSVPFAADTLQIKAGERMC